MCGVFFVAPKDDPVRKKEIATSISLDYTIVPLKLDFAAEKKTGVWPSRLGILPELLSGLADMAFNLAKAISTTADELTNSKGLCARNEAAGRVA